MDRTKRVVLDLETYSEADLVKQGTRRYAEDESTEIILFGFMQPNGKVAQYETQESIKKVIGQLNGRSDLTLVAHNANGFDRIVLEEKYGLQGVEWSDTKERALSIQEMKVDLATLAQKYGSYKMPDGKEGINKFSKPHKLQKKEAEHFGVEWIMKTDQFVRVRPEDDAEAWEEFKKYHAQDIVAGAQLDIMLPELTPIEHTISEITYNINKVGMNISMPLVDAIIAQKALNDNIQGAGFDINVGSAKQLMEWTAERGVNMPDTRAKTVEKLLAKPDLNSDVRDILQFRVDSNLASLAKVVGIPTRLTRNGRLHDYFVYFGASATGRFAGKGAQLQNLSHAKTKDYQALFTKLRNKNISNQEMQALVRPVFIAGEGKTFVVVDYSNIEARVQAWVSDDEHMQKVFREGIDIYKMQAVKMYNVDYEDTDPYRKDAKTATLALGYGGGVNALQAFGYEGEDPQVIVDLWRAGNTAITDKWDSMETDFTNALNVGGIHDYMIELPSGRNIRLEASRLRKGKRGYEFYSPSPARPNNPWVSMYGGKLFNRLVQGFARDVMAEAMVRVNKAGYTIVNSVHDELIIEVPQKGADKALEDVTSLMLAHGYEGLLLDAEGFTSQYYRK